MKQQINPQKLIPRLSLLSNLGDNENILPTPIIDETPTEIPLGNSTNLYLPGLRDFRSNIEVELPGFADMKQSRYN